MHRPNVDKANRFLFSQDDRDKPIYKQKRFWGIFLVVLFILFFVKHCATHQKQKGPAGQPVVIATAKTANVPVYIPGLGAVTPLASITVRTQLNGQLMQVLFKEGQYVKRGDLLAIVDPRPYEAALLQYQGQYNRDMALLNNASLDLKRYQKLWSQNAVSQQIYDTQKSLVQQYQGTVQIDQGLIASTKVNLIYTRITAPVDGRIGLRLVDSGNFVQTSDANGIAVIDTLNPISVVSTIPEDRVLEVLDEVNAGKELPVIAYDRAQTRVLATGKLLTLDNQVDPTTGTVKLRSLFQNENNLLFPNQFVNVNLLVRTLQNAIVVPTAAIQHGAQGDYIYVVHTETKKHSSFLHKSTTTTLKVQGVIVGVGVSLNEQTVINKGIKAGDQVVIQGADKLNDGSTVYVASPNPDATTDTTTAERKTSKPFTNRQYA